ncbi:extracellular solute-binding protein [Paenibacillaceae bacterium]|nr:extracellular solute-binding protein [Paenibacillaceae bacterium]
MKIRLLHKACSIILIISMLLLVQSALAQSSIEGQTATQQEQEQQKQKQAPSGLANGKEAAHQEAGLQETDLSSERNYSEALAAWRAEGIKEAQSAAAVDAGGPLQVSDPNALYIGSHAGRSNLLLWKSARKEWVEYEIDAPESALYEIHVTYHPFTDNGSTTPILWDIAIDGSRPFAEASSIALYRTWQDARPILTNRDGDEIRPRSKDVSSWSTKALVDSTGGYSEPLKWYFAKGKHTLRIAGYEGAALERIELVPAKAVPSYEEALAIYPVASSMQGAAQTLQAEDFTYKNDTSIKLFSDRNPRTVPRAKGRITYNTVGGARWSEQNQEVIWTFTAPESGNYTIGFRALQNTIAQKTSFRTVRIDGEVPFQQFLAYPFPYSASWQGILLEDNSSNPYYVYLEKGEHTLSLTSTHAPVKPVIRGIQQFSELLDTIDWDLRALVGNVVDRNRTWVMERDYPDLPERMLDIAEQMEQLAVEVKIINGVKDSISQGLDTAAKDIRSLLRKPEEIPYNVEEISSIREKLNLFIDSLLKQGLQLDEVYIIPEGGKKPDMEASAWNSFWGGLENFYYSFDSRDSITKLNDDKLNIWVQRGRDYVDQLQQLADEWFTPETGIEVKVNLLANPELLLMSNAAGVQPDIALGLTQDLPVDLAIRGSLQNLSEFAGFDDLYEQFSPGSWLPLYYDGAHYGVPETQSFQVLFYREDILKRLGIEVPQTWDEVYQILPTLQQNYMNFYINPLQFSHFFYQNNVEFYEPNGLQTAMDKPEAFHAFKQWTDLFNTYAIEPEVPSFYQHFRDGTMPIGISDYNMYVQLSAAAPELNDRWKIANMPGTVQPDGSISRWAGGGQRTGVIFKQSRKQEEAWKFLQWWLSADVQQQYGADLEAVNGIAFRWNTSNVEAFTRLPWKKEDAEVILNQWKWYKDIPNVPGGYYLDRETNNAWVRTVISKVNYRSSLEQAVRDINRELYRKQEEFGFIDAAGNRLKNLDIPVVDRPWEGIDRYVE